MLQRRKDPPLSPPTKFATPTYWLSRVLATGSTIGLLTALATFVSGCTISPAEVAWHAYPTATTTLPFAPPCKGRQLQASQGGGGSAGGNLNTTIDLTNIGGTCQLQGYPDLLGVSAMGAVPLVPEKMGTYFGNLAGANLLSGGVGELILGTRDAGGCDNADIHPDQPPWSTDEYRGVVIVLPDGQGTVTLNGGLDFDTACGLDESQLGVRGPTPQFPPPPGTFQALTATIRASQSVHWGRTLRYTVTLRNPFERAVSFLPCPGYTEELGVTPKNPGAKPPFVLKMYGLNCQRRRSLTPDASITFAMELRLPRSKVAGTGDLVWSANTTDGDPTTHATLRVLP